MRCQLSLPEDKVRWLRFSARAPRPAPHWAEWAVSRLRPGPARPPAKAPWARAPGAAPARGAPTHRAGAPSSTAGGPPPAPGPRPRPWPVWSSATAAAQLSGEACAGRKGRAGPGPLLFPRPSSLPAAGPGGAEQGRGDGFRSPGAAPPRPRPGGSAPARRSRSPRSSRLPGPRPGASLSRPPLSYRRRPGSVRPVARGLG